MNTVTQRQAPARTNGYITAKLDQPVELVAQYRANASAIRRLHRSRPARHVMATLNAVARREHDLYLAEISAAGFGTRTHRCLLGALVDERKLRDRLAKAKAANIARPELADRLYARRTQIRRLIKELS